MTSSVVLVAGKKQCTARLEQLGSSVVHVLGWADRYDMCDLCGQFPVD